MPAKRAKTARKRSPPKGKARPVRAVKKPVAAPKKTPQRKPKPKPKPRQEVKKEEAALEDGSQPLDNGQHERFCWLKAKCIFSNYSCYLQVYPDSTPEAARSSSSELLTKPHILRRIAWLKDKAADEVVYELKHAIMWCVNVIETPVGYVDDESPLAQEVERTITGTEEEGTITKVKVKTPSKEGAQKLLAKLKGWEKPVEVNLNLGYEPPRKAWERAKEKGIDVAAILKKVGLGGTGQ